MPTHRLGEELDVGVNAAVRASRLRWAAIGATAFVVLYGVHRLLQGLGPETSAPADLAAWIGDQRVPLLASELALGVALLAVIVFAAPLAVVLHDDGDAVTAAAFGLASAVFIAMGLVSLTAETALFAAATDPAETALAVLDALQTRVPNVLAGSALAATLAPAFLRRRIGWRWLGIVSLVAAAFFALGFVFGVLGSAPEGRGSVFGVAVFIVWMALVTAALWRAAAVEARRAA
ncbi:hypothetical protein ACFPER_04690 [Agromyces aurantiacus]|uniref:DUF4386 family protein n=1 Tax=Agromyces aurantiacus TaxID=165814 RepID=A0ABV9R1U6_9MICO|nr:hypothetical protein [Agromyces aurantiacus]MBM7502756.1 hypothetical protein [Agromyces aurantiacus]